MQLQLNQLERSDVWDLVPRLDKFSVICLKNVHKNKDHEEGICITNKSTIVSKGYKQEETNFL